MDVDKIKDLRPGDIIPPKGESQENQQVYAVENLLGEGGFGIVYACHPVRFTSQRYAIKIFKSSIAKRVKNEIMILQQLQGHPNIIQAHDQFFTPNLNFIVMERARTEKPTLRDEIGYKRKDGPSTFSLEETIYIAQQVVQALLHAYEKAKLDYHGDIKPANLLVFDSPSINGSFSYIVKIGDFGVALAQADEKRRLQHANFTQTSAAIGSPVYMAPEIGKPELKIDNRADLFSVAVVLRELLTGLDPVEEFNKRFKKGAFRRISEIRKDVPAELEEFIFRCLEDDREQRPKPSFAGLKSILDKYTGVNMEYELAMNLLNNGIPTLEGLRQISVVYQKLANVQQIESLENLLAKRIIEQAGKMNQDLEGMRNFKAQARRELTPEENAAMFKKFYEMYKWVFPLHFAFPELMKRKDLIDLLGV